jgi:hypothetical protein
MFVVGAKVGKIIKITKQIGEKMKKSCIFVIKLSTFNPL